MNALRKNLSDGGVSVGAWLTVPSLQVAEAMASLGFHWLAVDMEHGTAGPDQAASTFVACERHGVTSIVRLPSADPYLARRMLDAGAAGVIVPVVESADAFRSFINHCLYPPGGRRGVGLSRCNLWGDRFEQYIGEFRPFLVPQIESRAGVGAVDAIAEFPEVDAVFVGPYDLSASLGARGNFNTAEFKEALTAIRRACDRHRMAPGYHQVDPDPAALQAKISEGFRFIAYGTDVLAIRSALRQGPAICKSLNRGN